MDHSKISPVIRAGTRFSYSGEGFSLLQFVVEHGRKGLDVGGLTQEIFKKLDMLRTSLVWLNDEHHYYRHGEVCRRASARRWVQCAVAR